MSEPHRAALTWAGWRRGAREILPLCAFVFVLAASFGVAAQQAGLSAGVATLMSALVFAGGSQFAALAVLGPPVAMAPLLLGTLAINARLLLLGASLSTWLSRLPLWQQLASVTVLSDANWAQAMRAHSAGERDAGVLVGAGAAMWITWVLGTFIGVVASASIPDIRRYGLDALLLAFFAATLTEGWRGRADLPAALGAAVTAIVVARLGAHEWSVLAGGLGGAFIGAWSDEKLR